MPFLLPPPEFKPGELAQLGLTGTCELQVCRSAGPWSLGTPDRVEHSIQNAYLKGPLGLLTPNPRHRSLWSIILTTYVDSHSHPNVRTLRLHREPVLHHFDGGRRRDGRE